MNAERRVTSGKTFAEKVVVVTGASAGIGKVTALEFAKEGATVVVAARRVDRGEEVVKLIKDCGGEAIFIQTDVSKPASIQEMVSQTIGAYGRLDCAFNTPAIPGKSTC